jgi:hypothetical protein
MLIIEIFERGSAPRYRPTAPTAAIWIDTSRAASRDTHAAELVLTLAGPLPPTTVLARTCRAETSCASIITVSASGGDDAPNHAYQRPQCSRLVASVPVRHPIRSPKSP